MLNSRSTHALTQLDERSKREGPCSLLLDFQDRRQAVCSVEQEVLPCGVVVVMIATPSAVYILSGGPGLEGVFAQ